MKILLVTGIVLLSTACSMDEIKRFGYESGNQYVCNEQEPNLPDKVRQCRQKAQSYDEYQSARAETLSKN